MVSTWPTVSASIVSSELATAGFVPDLWSDEIMAAHKKNLVLATLVRKLSVKGKRGDSITVPTPGRATASSKASETGVILNAASGTGVKVDLTAHWELSHLIEDIAEVHAMASMRKFYTDNQGYALARAKDDQLFLVAATLNGGASTTTWDAAVIAGDGTTTFVDANDNESAITDAGIRRVIQLIDDNDFPMNDRYLVVPPVARRVLMGIARFTEQAFKGDGDTIKNGKLGQVYGVAVHVSSNCPTSSNGARIGVFAHKDAMVLADVLGPRVQVQYKQEFLSTLLTADTIFGCKEIYNLGGTTIAMPA